MLKNQHGFTHLGLMAGIITVVIIIGFIGWKVSTANRDKNVIDNAGMNTSVNPEDIQKPDTCIAAGAGIFTKDVTDVASVSLIQNPIRVIGGNNIKTHSYIEVKQRSPVYAPMDSTLSGGANYYETMGPNPVTKVQYLLSFNDGCDVSYWFDHLIDVPDTIKQAFPAEARNDTQAVNVKQVKVNAGDLIGYSNQPKAARFDFGVINLKGPETVLTTDARFKNNEIVKTSVKYRHAVCPYQFFDTSKTKHYVDLFDTTPDPDQVVIDNLCKALE